MRILFFLLLSINLFGQIEVVRKTEIRDFPKKLGEKLEIIPPLSCQVGDAEMAYYVDPGSIDITTQITKCVPWYVETDYFTYQAFGSNLSAVEAWIQNIIDEVAIIYENEGINIYLASTFVATSAVEDWSSVYNNVTDILYRFGAVRGDTINGRLKHFFTTRALGGGVAWVGTLCTNQVFYNGGESAFGPYAVSAQLSTTVVPYPNYSWTIEVVTHEAGHNFGSPHTHSCVWGPDDDMAVDECVSNTCEEVMPVEESTVMSYAHLTPKGIDFQLGFGTEPGNLIRAAVINATCLPECCSDEIILTGDISGTHIADKITLSETTNMNDVILDTKELFIENSVISPIFTLLNDGCN